MGELHNHNNSGEPLINIGFSLSEIECMVAFIDDEEVDEDEILGIRKKLKNRHKRLRRRASDGVGHD